VISGLVSLALFAFITLVVTGDLAGGEGGSCLAIDTIL
jgi:hypothetical protein